MPSVPPSPSAPPPPPPPLPPPLPTVDRINARYQRAPFDPWAEDGTLADAGLLIHCFDAVECPDEKWRPGIGCGSSADNPSGSVIFRDQCLSPDGAPHFAPGVSLFGHACSGGGVILRPGRATRILCGHGKDFGARCGAFCPPTERGATDLAGPKCASAWRPADVHTYLFRETDDYRRNPEWGHYNEFIIDGRHWDANLPDAVEAFMSGRSGAEVERVHADFLQKHGLRAEGVDGVPLLTMTPNMQLPFAVGARYASEGDPTRLGAEG